MDTLLLIVHIVVCFFLVVIVLLQQGKGADIGATFGGSSQSLFGTEGPLPLLNKITTFAAVIFMVTSLTLAWFSAQEGHRSVMSGVGGQTAEESVPAAEKVVAQPAADEVKSSDAAEKSQPVAKQPPAAEQPAAKQPAAEEPAKEKPAAKQPVAEQPAAE